MDDKRRIVALPLAGHDACSMFCTMQTQPVAQPATRPAQPSSPEPAPELAPDLQTKGRDDDDDLYSNLAHTD